MKDKSFWGNIISDSAPPTKTLSGMLEEMSRRELEREEMPDIEPISTLKYDKESLAVDKQRQRIPQGKLAVTDLLITEKK